jgi:hypothetical protein
MYSCKAQVVSSFLGEEMVEFRGLAVRAASIVSVISRRSRVQDNPLAGCQTSMAEQPVPRRRSSHNRRSTSTAAKKPVRYGYD